jgi:steroid delta-isomerase-like uncharacterized protein
MNSFVQRIVDAYSSPTFEGLDALLTDDVVLLRASEKARGRDEYKGVLVRLRRAFPDIQYRVDDAIVTADRAVIRWEARGTHQGEYLGVPATGRPVSYSGITLLELRDGRIARAWVAADLFSLLRRLQEGRAAATSQATA